MSINALREVLNTVGGDPREFVAAYESDLDRHGTPLNLYVAVQRWNAGTL